MGWPVGPLEELPIAGANVGIVRALAFDSEILALGAESTWLHLYFWRDAVREAVDKNTQTEEPSYANSELTKSFEYKHSVSAIGIHNE